MVHVAAECGSVARWSNNRMEALMIALAINILWLLIGAIILAGVLWLVIYGIKKFVVDIPERIEQGIWFIVLILIVIAALSMLATGNIHGPTISVH